MANDNFVGLTGTALPTHNAAWTDSISALSDISLSDANGALDGGPSDRATCIPWRNRGGYRSDSVSDVSNVLIVPRTDGFTHTRSVAAAIRMTSATLGYTLHISTADAAAVTNIQFKRDAAWIGGAAINVPATSDIEIELIGTIQGADLLVEAFINRELTPSFTYLDTVPLPQGFSGIYFDNGETSASTSYWSDELLSGAAKNITQIGDVEIGIGVTSNQGIV